MSNNYDDDPTLYCDFCREVGIEKPAKYDAKTKMGPWASMCEAHNYRYGIGLGVGKGQKIDV